MRLGAQLWFRWSLFTAVVGGMAGAALVLVGNAVEGSFAATGSNWLGVVVGSLASGALMGASLGLVLGLGAGLAIVGVAVNQLRQGRWSSGLTKRIRTVAIAAIILTGALVVPILLGIETGMAILVGCFALSLAATTAAVTT